MNTTTNPTPETQDRQETIANAIAGIGAAWARYGLRVGAVALESQSRHMEALGHALAGTAKTLADMAEKMAKPADDASQTTPAPEDHAAGSVAREELAPRVD